MAEEVGGGRRGVVELGEALPEVAVDLSTAALIWLFGVLVFLPMAKRIDPIGLPIICSLLILSTFSLFLIRGLRRLANALDRIAEILSQRWSRRGKIGRERWIKVGLRTATAMTTCLLYLPLLSAIHPSLVGVAVIMTFLGLPWMLAKR